MTRSPQKTPHDGRRRFLVGSFGLAAASVCPPLAYARPKRILTVYHSRTGNTRKLAELLHRQVGGDLVRVETVEPYPEDYEATVSQARRERDTGRWPALKTHVEDIRGYDVVMLRSPIWGDHLNPPMKSFLKAHDLSRRTIAPFVSYKVSRLGQALRNMREIAPQATILPGLAVLDADTAAADVAVANWIRRLEFA